MRKARAIAIVYDNPFSLALDSAGNFIQAVFDFMYGTPARSRVTFLFAAGLMCLGLVMKQSGLIAPVCGL